MPDKDRGEASLFEGAPAAGETSSGLKLGTSAKVDAPRSTSEKEPALRVSQSRRTLKNDVGANQSSDFVRRNDAS